MAEVKPCRCNGDGPELVYLDVSNPYSVTYFDEDRRAMDETNWDAILEELRWLNQEGEYDRYVIVEDYYYGRDTERLLATLPEWVRRHDKYALHGRDCDRCIHVPAADVEVVEVLQRVAGQLDAYPLLDEDAYSAREYDAWCEWWAGDGFSELIRDTYDDEEADATLDLPNDMLADLSTAAQQGMGYYSGFSGEYDEAGARKAVLKWERDIRWLADEDRRTMGGRQVELFNVEVGR